MKQDPRTIIDITQDVGLSKKLYSAPAYEVNNSLFHWVPDRPDSRDYLYRVTSTSSGAVVDLRPYASPIEDQGPLGSCTGQAIAGAIELLNKKNQKPTDVSRLYIYYYERMILGTINYDSGAYIRDGMKATNKWGAPLEKYWPYQINKFKSSPSSTAVNDGFRRKVTRYERAADFTACVNALNNGYPVVIGFHVYSSFMSKSVVKTGKMPYPNIRKEVLLGGHAVLLVGYNNSTQTFIARNSWGANWGDRGYFYMPYEVIRNTSMSSDFWVIKGVDNP